MFRHSIIDLAIATLLFSVAIVCSEQLTTTANDVTPSPGDAVAATTIAELEQTAAEPTRPVTLVAFQADAQQGKAAAAAPPAVPAPPAPVATHPEAAQQKVQAHAESDAKHEHAGHAAHDHADHDHADHGHADHDHGVSHSGEVLGCCCETVCELRCVRVGLFKLRTRRCWVPVTNWSLCPIHAPMITDGGHGESIMIEEGETDASEKESAEEHAVEELPAPVPAEPAEV